MINKKRFIKYGSGILIAAALITSTLSTSILQSVQSVFADDQAPNTCNFDGQDGTDYHYTCTYDNDGGAIGDASAKLFIEHLGSKNAGLAAEEYLHQNDGSNVHQAVVNQTQDGTHWQFAGIRVTLNSSNSMRRENLTFHADKTRLFYSNVYPVITNCGDVGQIEAITQSIANNNPKYGNNVIFSQNDDPRNADPGTSYSFKATRYGQVISDRVIAIEEQGPDGVCMYSKAWYSDDY